MTFEGLMKGKRGLIMGVANDRSIAWGIAEALHRAGAELAFTYQGDVFKKRVVPLVTPMKPAALIDCDVSNQGSLDAPVRRTQDQMGHARFRRPRHRLFRQGPAQGPLRRHHARQFPHDDGHLLLLVHRGGAARREDDAERRLDGDAHLFRRREGHAALQRDGRGEGRARSERALHGRGSRQEEHPRQCDLRRTDQDAGGFAASAISATSSNGTNTTRRCAAT